MTTYGLSTLVNFTAVKLASLHNTAARVRGSSPVQYISTVFDGVLSSASATSGTAPSITTPTFPTSTTAVTNTTGYDVLVQIIGGTITHVKVNTIDQGAVTAVVVPNGATISITYSSTAPTWNWELLNGLPQVPAGYVNITVAGSQYKMAYFNA